MRRQKKSIGEIVVALSELNLPRQSRSFLFRYALQHRYEASHSANHLFLEMAAPYRGGFGESGGMK